MRAFRQGAGIISKSSDIQDKRTYIIISLGKGIFSNVYTFSTHQTFSIQIYSFLYIKDIHGKYGSKMKIMQYMKSNPYIQREQHIYCKSFNTRANQVIPPYTIAIPPYNHPDRPKPAQNHHIQGHIPVFLNIQADLGLLW